VRTLTDALDALELGRRARPSKGETRRALARLAANLPRRVPELFRLHEALLFHAAYPENASVRRAALDLLAKIPGRVRELAAAGADLSELDEPEQAGVGGTTVRTTFSYDFLQELVRRRPNDLRIDWDAFEREDRLAATLPRIVPLLEEEALADANVPYRAWIDAARGRRPELPWLLERFASLRLSPAERAELFDGLGLPVEWRLSDDAARGGARLAVSRTFFHPRPLLSRRDVDLRKILDSPRLTIRRLPVRDAERRLELARETLGTRYRELYGFTYGDPGTARVADVGRGCDISLFGAPPGRRLPLRASFAAFVVKNGIPVAYVEGLALFERIEVGFNVFYTFREGESAWIYAQVLKLFKEALGVTSFSVDPYQVGHENEEAIESGAFWFYRKLGFQSTSRDLRAATAAEEDRLAADEGRRTPPRVLRRLATRNLLFDATSLDPSSDWERFHIRNVALAVDRRMAREFGGDAQAIRRRSASSVERKLGIDASRWTDAARAAFQNLALVVDLVRGVPRWSSAEKASLARALRTKSAKEERRFLALLRGTPRLRKAILRLGSA
jgi:hypothetical protein